MTSESTTIASHASDISRVVKDGRALVLGYLGLRRMVGIIGFFLPVALLLWGDPERGSMSAYYYSNLRDIFVGSLCAVGVFLFFYRGYEPIDQVLGKLTAVGVIGLALFPTTDPDVTGGIPWVHVGFTALFFACAFWFAVFRFPFPKPESAPSWLHPMDRIKAGANSRGVRNGLYRLFAAMMVIGLTMIGTHHYLGRPAGSNIIFWGEAVALWGFGLSWALKGWEFEKDPPDLAQEARLARLAK